MSNRKAWLKLETAHLPFTTETYTFPCILGNHADRHSKYCFSFPLLGLSLQSKIQQDIRPFREETLITIFGDLLMSGGFSFYLFLLSVIDQLV